MKPGITFSQQELKWRQIEIAQALQFATELRLNVVRLAVYWDEIEKKPGKFNFSEIDTIVEHFSKHNVEILFSLGMKAPRWPEYYVPEWVWEKNPILGNLIENGDGYLKERLFMFLEKTYRRYNPYKNIKTWQIENEPLDLASPRKLKISPKLLEEEINLIKKLDPRRKVLVSLWANEVIKNNNYQIASDLSDIVGFDLYLKRPIQYLKYFTRYTKPFDSEDKIKEIVRKIREDGKDFWITECQAEPWGNNFTLNDIERNFSYCVQFDPEVILLWGFEFWLNEKLNGDSSYWERAKNILK